MKRFLIGLLVAFGLSGAAQAQSTKVLLDEGNVVTLRGEVDDMSVAKVQQQILSNPNKELWLYISSPGGSVLAGMQLVETLRSTPKKVKCIASVAASMAFTIMQFCHERYVTEQSIIMQHVASFGLQGQEPNVRTFSDFLGRTLRWLEGEEAKRLGLTTDAFRAKIRDDWWLFGAESVSQKVADGLVSVTCTERLSSKVVHETIQGMFFSADVAFSACPVVEGPVAFKVNNRAATLDADREISRAQQVYRVREAMQAWFTTRKSPLSKD